ncbi:MAG: hypothetical protein J6I99_07815, partial [Oscillospiraceae bacterium]|nr:hypothetical protein [Oscillospiraceae bacterium]
CVYPAEIDRKNARMRQHAGVFAANFSSNLLWQNCFAPKKSAFCAEPRRVAAGILGVCQGGATMGLRQTRLLRRMFSYARRPKGHLLPTGCRPLQMTVFFNTARCIKCSGLFVHRGKCKAKPLVGTENV